MTSTQLITTGLSKDLVEWLSKYSKAKKQTKRSILEEALRRYRFETRRREFQKGFAKAAKDKEILELAEEGLEDYLNQLNSLLHEAR